MSRRIILCFLGALAGLVVLGSTAPAQVPPPGDFQLTGYLDSTKTVHLSWDAPGMVTALRYYVYRVATPVPGAPFDSASIQLIDSTAGTVREYSDHPAIPNSGGYSYRILALTPMGIKQSNPLFVSFSGAPAIELKLRAAFENSGRVHLEWNAPLAFSVSHYLLYRVVVSATGEIPDSTKFARIDSLGAGSTDAIDQPPALANGGSYAYRLLAVSEAGTRLLSNLAFVYVPLPEPPETFRLWAFVDSSSVTQLRWDAPLNVTVLKYYIYRSQPSMMAASPDPASGVLIDSTTLLMYSDSYTVMHTGYFAYQVWATVAMGKPIGSNVALVLVGPLPTTQYIRLEASLTDSGKPRLQWESPVGMTFQKYYLYRATYDPRRMTPVPVFPVLFDSTTSSEYVDQNPPPTSYGYLYQVRGLSDGKRVESNLAAVVVYDQIVLSATTDFDGGSIKLHWTKPAAGVPLYYLVYRNAITDSTGQIDTLRWARIDSLTDNDDRDVPSSKALAFAYRVAAVFPTHASIWSNIAVVPWHSFGVPFTLKGHAEGDGSVQLAWNDATGFPVAQYHVYRAALARNTTRFDSTIAFSLIDSTTNQWIADHPPLNISNSFVYYVKASGSGEVAFTNKVLVVFSFPPGPMGDFVAIISTPVREGRVGTLYSYQLKALSSDSTATFRWTLGEHPSGMTIDSLSGLVQWTPAAKGWFETTVLVFSSMGGRGKQEYMIAVAGASGSVSGTVTDTLGNPIRALINLYKRDTHIAFEYTAVTDSAGAYYFNHVDVGSYIARAVALAGDYVPQWYYEKSSPLDANPILVADSSAVAVNFVLKARSTEVPFFKVSGGVFDTLGQPIHGAVVTFARVEFLLNSAKNLGPDDHNLENDRDLLSAAPSLGLAFGAVESGHFAFRTQTDSTGAYSLTLPRGAYIGVAFAQGYRKIFYNGETDLLSADVLKLTTDTSGINFTLQPIPPVALGSIGGTVMDTSSGQGVPSRVLAFRIGPFRPVDSYFAESDMAGAYTIADLPPGEYYVLAVPLGKYAPSFYSLTGPTLRWKMATKVGVNSTAVSGIDIFVQPISATAAGYTYIEGSVTTTSPSGGLFKAAAAVGVDGSIVYATDATGRIAGYSVTDADGNYMINGLSPGGYTVTGDRIGFDEPSSSTVNPTYDASGAPIPGTASFTMVGTTTGVETGTTAVPSEYSLSQNYPNPFNPTTQIAFTIPQQQQVTLKVYNLLGQEIATLVDRVLSAGTFTVTWNGRSQIGTPVTSGVYFYQMKAGNFADVKRMILLK